MLFPEAQINVCGIPFHDHLAASLRYANRVIRTHTGHLQTHLFPQQHEMKQECKGKMRGANGSRRVSMGLCIPRRVTCGAEVRHVARSQRARPCHFVHSDTDTQEAVPSALWRSIRTDLFMVVVSLRTYTKLYLKRLAFVLLKHTEGSPFSWICKTPTRSSGAQRLYLHRAILYLPRGDVSN